MKIDAVYFDREASWHWHSIVIFRVCHYNQLRVTHNGEKVFDFEQRKKKQTFFSITAHQLFVPQANLTNYH